MTSRFVRLVALTVSGFLTACTGSVENPGGDGTGTGNSGAGPGSGSGGLGTGNAPGNGGATGTGATTNPPPGTGGSPPGTVAIKLDEAPAYLRFVRLTNEQWANSVKDILNLPTIPDGAADFQSAVSGMTDFTNNEIVLGMDDRASNDFLAVTEAVAAQVTATDAALTKVYTGTDAAGFISTLGRRAYRRQLTTAEKTSYMNLYNTGSTLTGTRSAFAKGASLVIRAMLRSPYFTYRTEMSAPAAALTGYEIAAKVSLLLKNTTPNDALLDQAAGPGKLETADGAVNLAKTLLEDPAASKVMRGFHGQYLHFDRFQQISKLNVPTYKPALNDELEEASYLFFDKIFSKGLGLKEVFTATTGFVGKEMAAVYGTTAPASGYAEQALDTKRRGFFTQLPFLVMHAHNGDPSGILRGVQINLDVLCSVLPPPQAVPGLPDPVAGETTRQRTDRVTAACGASCHNAMINPIGFAFEHFDGMGQYRDDEKVGTQTLPIDSSGTFQFIDGTKSFANSTELMDVLANGQQAHLCYAKKLAGFALQRGIVAKDMPMLTSLTTSSTASNGSIKQLILDLVKQDAFRLRGAQ